MLWKTQGPVEHGGMCAAHCCAAASLLPNSPKLQMVEINEPVAAQTGSIFYGQWCTVLKLLLLGFSPFQGSCDKVAHSGDTSSSSGTSVQQCARLSVPQELGACVPSCFPGKVPLLGMAPEFLCVFWIFILCFNSPGKHLSAGCIICRKNARDA